MRGLPGSRQRKRSAAGPVSTGAPLQCAVAEPASRPTAVAATAQPAETPQPQPATTEGTLHKPVVKPEDKAAKAEKKKKQTKQVVWKDERVEKRGLKTRGDLSGGKGWRTRRDKHGKALLG